MIRINCREHFACIDSNAMGSKESSSSSDLAPNAAVTSGFKTNSTTRETWRWICSFQHRQTQHHLWKNKTKKKKDEIEINLKNAMLLKNYETIIYLWMKMLEQLYNVNIVSRMYDLVKNAWKKNTSFELR